MSELAHIFPISAVQLSTLSAQLNGGGAKLTAFFFLEKAFLDCAQKKSCTKTAIEQV